MNRASVNSRYAGCLTAALALLTSTPAFAQNRSLRWEDYWKTDLRLKYGRNWPMVSVTLNGHRQLFVDNVVIEYMRDLDKTLHQPVKYEGNPVVPLSKPWEGEVTMGTVIREEDGRFRFWYLAAAGTCYAESKDGIHWEKPALRLHEWVGKAEEARKFGLVVPEGAKDFRTRDNNIVLTRPGGDVPNIIKDPLEKDAQKRYKMFIKYNEPVYGMYVGYSPDGLRWTFNKDPVLTTANDPGLNDRPTMFYDTENKRYVASLKREMPNPFGTGDYGMLQRCRTTSVSTDFEHWTDPVLSLTPDDQVPPGMQIYGLVGFNYESMYLGLMDIFWSQLTGPMQGALDIQLALSRDGIKWWRAGNRKTFIPVGPDGAWDQIRLHPCSNPPILVGDELWFYYRGKAGRHFSIPEQRRGFPWFAPGRPEDGPLYPGQITYSVGLAKLRRDGFVSVDAGPRPGILMTRPLVFAGDRLHVNFDTKGGRIRAAVYAADFVPGTRYPFENWKIGQPAPGFTLDDCTPIRANTLDGVLNWKGGGLKQFEGKSIVVLFELVESSLYSFWID